MPQRVATRPSRGKIALPGPLASGRLPELQVDALHLHAFQAKTGNRDMDPHLYLQGWSNAALVDPAREQG